jgi:hypothetical protein
VGGNRVKASDNAAAALAAAATAPDTTWETISRMIECTVCFDSINGPIYQCHEGHLLCSLCWGRLYQPSAGCPTCSGVLGNVRCRFAESVRDACLNSEPSSPGGKKRGEVRKQLAVSSKHQTIKKAAEGIGVPIEDLRGIMAREGVPLMEAMILAARTRVKGHIEESGGVDAYEKKKRESARAAVEKAVAVALDPAKASPLRKLPQKPAGRPPLAECCDSETSRVLARTESPRIAGTGVRTSNHRLAEQKAHLEAKGHDAAAQSLRQEEERGGGTRTQQQPRGSPKKRADQDKSRELVLTGAESVSLEEKLSRYKEEIRKKVDDIWNEVDRDAMPQEASATRSLDSDAKPLELRTAREAQEKADSNADDANAAGAASAARGKAAAAAEARANASAAEAAAAPAARPNRGWGQGEDVAKGKDASSALAVSPELSSTLAKGGGGGGGISPKAGGARAALNADVVAAYSSFRREMRSKVLATLRASREDSAQDGAGKEGGGHEAKEAYVHVHAARRAGGAEVVEAHEESPGGVSSPIADSAAAAVTFQCGDSASSPGASEDGSSSSSSSSSSKVQSEAQTRSNSANLDASACLLAGVVSPREPCCGLEDVATMYAIALPRAGAGGEAGPANASEHSHLAVRAHGARSVPASSQVSSSLEKLRFPKIRTDIAVQQAHDELAAEAAGMRTLSQAGVQTARAELGGGGGWGGSGGREGLVKPSEPPAGRPPSTTRSLRVSATVSATAVVARPPSKGATPTRRDAVREGSGGREHKSVSRSGAAQSGGSEQKSATPTPRDAVRAVLDGDRKGSGVWKIVAGVRNRLRAGPGR